MHRLLAILTCLYAIALAGTPKVEAQANADDQIAAGCRKLPKLVKALNAEHFQPITFDDATSEALFSDFLAGLDPDGLFFTAADLEALSPFRSQLDDEIQSGSCGFLPVLAPVFRRAVNRADSIAGHLLEKPFDLKQRQRLVIEDLDEPRPAADLAELQARWSRYLKYKVLSRMLSPADTTEDPLNLEVAVLLRREAEARTYVQKRVTRAHRRLLEPKDGFGKQLISGYFSTIAAMYDPHTEYFSPDEKMRFDAIITSTRYAFGFSLAETRSGDFKVARIAPGGPAWRTNALHDDDVLIGCTISGEAPLDLSELDLSEFEERLSDLRVQTIVLTVRKSDGRIEMVTLRKEKVEEEEAMVRGLMLEGNARVGYIALPGFYSESENDPQSGCGNDVAREVIKLKREGMKGLILDLRNNGGGSVKEAAELAGIFLDYGPLFLGRDQMKEVYAIKDPNRGYAWQGPLVILVNGLSASASELVSGALQDHRRAVIVGSPTYGKSTGQIVVPVAGTGDFIKVTASKFNRITGASYQLVGLQPDVPVPDVFEGLQYREAAYPHTLEQDMIEKYKYFSPGDSLPLAMLRGKSLDRIDNDTRFVRFSMFNQAIKKVLDYPLEIPLEINAFLEFEKERGKLLEEWEAIFARENATFKVRTAQSDRELVEGDDFRRETYRALIEKISRDFIVEEGYNVLINLIDN